jgi:hypothetical protein
MRQPKRTSSRLTRAWQKCLGLSKINSMTETNNEQTRLRSRLRVLARRLARQQQAHPGRISRNMEETMERIARTSYRLKPLTLEELSHHFVRLNLPVPEGLIRKPNE